MEDFSRFIKDSKFPDIVIQMALRNIDSAPLALALADQGEEVRELVFGNMSLRAVAYLREEIPAAETCAPGEIEAAQELFARLLRGQMAVWEKEGTFPAPPSPPEMDLSNREAIIRSFAALAQFVRRQGFLPLYDLRDSVDSPLLRQGLQMLVEGWDPLLLRSVLERSKESRLRAAELEYDLIIEGIDSLSSHDHALVTEQRLRSYVDGL